MYKTQAYMSTRSPLFQISVAHGTYLGRLQYTHRNLGVRIHSSYHLQDVSQISPLPTLDSTGSQIFETKGSFLHPVFSDVEFIRPLPRPSTVHVHGHGGQEDDSRDEDLVARDLIS